MDILDLKNVGDGTFYFDDRCFGMMILNVPLGNPDNQLLPGQPIAVFPLAIDPYYRVFISESPIPKWTEQTYYIPKIDRFFLSFDDSEHPLSSEELLAMTFCVDSTLTTFGTFDSIRFDGRIVMWYEDAENFDSF